MIAKEMILQILKDLKPHLTEHYKVCAIGHFVDNLDTIGQTEAEIVILFEFSEPGMGSNIKNIQEAIEEAIGQNIRLIRENSLKGERKAEMLSRTIWV